MKDNVYRQLQQHFDSFPLRFPKTETGVEIRLLKRLFTPEEAKIATFLKCGHWGSLDSLEPLETIFERVKDLGFSKKVVEKHLDNMVKKGSIIRITKKGKKHYANTLLVLGIYEHQVDKLTKEFLEDFYQFMRENWGPENKVSLPQMRTIPVGIKIDHENPIAQYDDIKALFEKSTGPFSIINCVCRQSQDLFDNSCKMTDRREVCMGFGTLAQVYIENGWGREITKEQALDYLKQNEEEALIFRPGNSQEMDFVCSCCYCCCGGIASLKRMPNPADYVTNNYFATINQELCSGCGICVERCQMDAITMEKNLSIIEQKRCIGCANCIITCPEKAITLQQKEEIKIPPVTLEELYEKIAEETKTNKAFSKENK